MEQLNVRLLLTIAAKVVFWVGYTFLQKPSSFKFLSILEENSDAHINIEAIKCKFLLTNVSQNVFWVSHNFLQKLSSFKFYSILEENCVVHINIGRMKCKTFVDNCCKNCVCKGQVFWNISEFDHHFQEISLFVKLTILGKSIFEGFDGVEMWWGRNFIY